MVRRSYNKLGSLVISAAVAFFPAVASGQPAIEPLLKIILEDLGGSEASVVTIDMEPGGETVRHIHPGHVFVYLLEGTVEVEIEGQETVVYTAGQALYETANMPMIARNASATERVKVVVFHIGPAGEPIMIAQPE